MTDHDLLYVLNIIDLRCNEPDAYPDVYRNKEDAIQAGIQYSRNNGSILDDDEIRNELDDGDGINIRNELYILPIYMTRLK